MDLLNRKAVSLSIRTIMILVLGVVLVLTMMSLWGSFSDGASDRLENSSDESQQMTSDAECKFQCRQDNPFGGGNYEQCAAGC